MAGPDGTTALAPGRSFGAVAAGYAALRPGYPADAVAHLLGPPRDPSRVLDLPYRTTAYRLTPG